MLHRSLLGFRSDLKSGTHLWALPSSLQALRLVDICTFSFRRADLLCGSAGFRHRQRCKNQDWRISKACSLVDMDAAAQDADAVLTTRDKLKGGEDALILSARAAGQPIFSMKTGSHASMVKALRSLAGIDPSPLSLRDASAGVGRPPFTTSTSPLHDMLYQKNEVVATHPCGQGSSLQSMQCTAAVIVLIVRHATRRPDVCGAHWGKPGLTL